MPQHSFVLTLSCDDRPGIVAAVTVELFELGANIAESSQFWDQETGRFFMRIAFTAPEAVQREDIERALKPAIERFGMKTALADSAHRPRLLILVSKFDHALLHLIYQKRVGWLDAGPRDEFALEIEGLNLLPGANDEPLARTVLNLADAVVGLLLGAYLGEVLRHERPRVGWADGATELVTRALRADGPS